MKTLLIFFQISILISGANLFAVEEQVIPKKNRVATEDLSLNPPIGTKNAETKSYKIRPLTFNRQFHLNLTFKKLNILPNHHKNNASNTPSNSLFIKIRPENYMLRLEGKHWESNQKE